MTHQEEGYHLGLGQFHLWVSADKAIRQKLNQDPSERFLNWHRQFQSETDSEKNTLLMALAASIVNSNEMHNQ